MDIMIEISLLIQTQKKHIEEVRMEQTCLLEKNITIHIKLSLKLKASGLINFNEHQNVLRNHDCSSLEILNLPV